MTAPAGAFALVQQATAVQYLQRMTERLTERDERLRAFNRTLAHEFRNRIGAASGAASSLPTTAVIPRRMFAPWSASPMAESSAVSASALSVTASAKLRSQRPRAADPTVSCPTSSGNAQTPRRRPGVFTGASHRRSSSSSSFSRVTEQPAMSRLVM